ncbi:MAG: co-chaperone GroES [Planctomycetes bacterium]|nr:co-chaperone GroES [Planctomycetota bacterium]
MPDEPSEEQDALTNRSSEGSKRLETVEPVGKRVLIRKDEDKKITRVGIHLPDKMEIPTLTGRVVAVSSQVERDPDYCVERYDRVLFHPKHAIPVDFEGDNRLFVVPIEDVVAVFRSTGSIGE